jgi:hypothetical protein
MTCNAAKLSADGVIIPLATEITEPNRAGALEHQGFIGRRSVESAQLCMGAYGAPCVRAQCNRVVLYDRRISQWSSGIHQSTD